MPAAPTSRFLDANGLKLHHLDWGNAGAMPLLFVHGLSANAHAFDAPAARYSDRFHVVAVDVRGRGDSAWSPAGAYEQSDYVADLEGVVDALGFERFVLAGTSMGGRIAIEYAGRHPKRLAGLVINDIGPDAEAGSERIRQNQGNVPESFARLEDVVAHRSRTSPVFANLDPKTQLERVHYDVRLSDDGRYHWKHDPAWQKQRFERGSFDYTYLWPVLEGIDVAALLFWGTVSDVLSEHQACRIASVMPRCELVPVPGVGHAPTLSEPAAIEALDRFLAAIIHDAGSPAHA